MVSLSKSKLGMITASKAVRPGSSLRGLILWVRSCGHPRKEFPLQSPRGLSPWGVNLTHFWAGAEVFGPLWGRETSSWRPKWRHSPWWIRTLFTRKRKEVFFLKTLGPQETLRAPVLPPLAKPGSVYCLPEDRSDTLPSWSGEPQAVKFYSPHQNPLRSGKEQHVLQTSLPKNGYILSGLVLSHPGIWWAGVG